MIHVSGIYRHPIKSHGRESMERVTLTAGTTMPFDRKWGIAHDHAKVDGGAWAPCANFSRIAKAPALMAIEAKLNDETQEVTLTHPDCDPITMHPTRDEAKLIAWVMPLVPKDRALPARVIEMATHGLTDSPYASVSLCNTASHHAVEALHHGPLSPMRWRGNIWFDGAAAWEEFDWIGQELRLGNTTLRVKERIERCMATTANPNTGKRDEDTLRTLNILGHQDFGICVEVTHGGEIRVGDQLELL